MSSTAPDIISTPIDDLSPEAFAYHPKVKARFMTMLKQAQEKLENCKPEELADAQATVKICRIALGLPEKVLEDEKRQRGK